MSVLAHFNSLAELHAYLPDHHRGASGLWRVGGGGGGVLVPLSLDTGPFMNQNSQKAFYIPEVNLLYDVATSNGCHSLMGFYIVTLKGP